MQSAAEGSGNGTRAATAPRRRRTDHVSSVMWSLLVSAKADLHKMRKANAPRRPTRLQGLHEDGIVVTKDHAPRGLCQRLQEQILALADAHPEGGDTPNGAHVRIRGSRRGNAHDEGMIDVFRVDQEIPEARLVADDAALLAELNTVTGYDLVPRRVNAYINRGVTATRGYHVDSYSSISYKGLLYLSDVLEPEDGPFSYVRGSHRFSLGKYRGLLAKATRPDEVLTNVTRVDPRRIEMGLAPRGTLFIADQTGTHRGSPQAPGRERVVLVTLYAPKDAKIE